MPTIQSERLQDIACRLLQAAGASEEEAAIVSRHSVSANLAGHDSHGVIQIPKYVEQIKRGEIVPGASMEIVKETPTTLVIDGNWGFGYVVSERSMEMIIEKARRNSVAAATVFRQSHVGRLTEYPGHGGRSGDDRHDDRGFGSGGEIGGPFRWTRGAVGDQSDLFRHAQRPGRTVIHRYSDQRGSRWQANRRGGQRDRHPGGMAPGRRR